MDEEKDGHIANILSHLCEIGFLTTDKLPIMPLIGGVSSDIFLVHDGNQQLVIKRALPKLKVKDDWYADTSRNRIEQAYFRFVSQIIPQSVPTVLYHDLDLGFFVMPYYGISHTNWKQLLLSQHTEQAVYWTVEIAKILATIHLKSWNNAELKSDFATDRNFYQLRLEPYLLATAERHPPLADDFRAEVARLSQNHHCLVHGDYSPKNILVPKPSLDQKEVMILDAEVAWFGDPVFDVAFILKHFLLKSLYATFTLKNTPTIFLEMVLAFWQQYDKLLVVNFSYRDQMEKQITHLVPLLLLARIDGKSTAEYLTDQSQKRIIRELCYRMIQKKETKICDLIAIWRQGIG